MGGWYIVYRNYLVIYRRAQQTMRGYLWNYEARAADIVPPMLIWEVVGNFAMPKVRKERERDAAKKGRFIFTFVFSGN